MKLHEILTTTGVLSGNEIPKRLYKIIRRKELDKKPKKCKKCGFIYMDSKKCPKCGVVNEGKEFKTLRDNKLALTDEERKEVIGKKAVWHHGPNGEETPAVFKTKDNSGKTWYVTNTHRVYQKRPTLKGAISIFHSFVKGTA